MYYKKLFIPILSLVGSLGILLILQKTVLSQIIFPNILVHSFVLLAFTSALFFVCFFSYQKYIKDKEICYYIVSLSFYILGVFAFAHAVLVPAFGWGNEALFDISEHYGFFLTSLLLWGLIIPFSEQIKENIYQARTKIFLGTNFLLLVGFASLFFLPSFAGVLFGSVNFFIALTGISFFVLFLVLLAKKDNSFFTSSLPSVLALLTISTLAPFFYREWNLTWWYVHLLELSAVLLLLLLLRVKEEKEKQISEILFSSFSIRTRLLFIVGMVLAIVIVNGAIDFRLSQAHVKAQTLDNMVLIADLQEGQVLNYLNKLKSTAVNFASDGFISTSLEKILSGDHQAVNDLSRHLLENKQPLDPAIFGIHIMDLNGKVVASSMGSEIGKEDMAQDEVFIQAKGSRLANAYLSDIMEEAHFGEKNIAILVTAPIIDQEITQFAGEQGTNENLGVIMLFFKTQGLSDILTGKQQTKQGALSTWTARKKTMETYMVNQDGQMITESKFIMNAPLKQKVDSLPVHLCKKSEETSGEYLDYRKIPVFGASMCFANGWTLLAEIDKEEVMATLQDYFQQNLLSGSATFLLIFMAIYLFSTSIIWPLQELGKVAQKIGKGDFTARAQLLTKDEFGKLAQVFNGMVENIQKGSASLQEKIKIEETNRLAVSNILGDLEEEKKRAENFARDLEKFKLATESTSDMVVISDPEGIALYANPATELITGYTVKETIGKKSGSLWGGHMETAYYQEMWQTIKVQKKPFVNKIKNKKKNGELYDAVIAISPVVDQKGNILFFVDTSHDITKEVEVDRAKTEFVSVASHELRTPLTAIDGLVSMILDGEYGEINNNLKQPLADINTSSERLIHLVNDMLNLSRIQAGRMKYTLSDFSLADVITEAVHLLQPLSQQKGLQLKVTKLDPVTVQGDSDKVKEVLNNLIGNSLKFTDKGSITVSTKVVEDTVQVHVTDTGIGISKEDQTKLFGQFVQLESGKGRPTGTGLGLHVSKEIARKMGGELWIEKSEVGAGSTFAFSIPLAKSSAAQKAKKEIEEEAKAHPDQKYDTMKPS